MESAEGVKKGEKESWEYETKNCVNKIKEYIRKRYW